ncbi:MAG: hypothetical protein ACWA5R_03640 [bacterium]
MMKREYQLKIISSQNQGHHIDLDNPVIIETGSANCVLEQDQPKYSGDGARLEVDLKALILRKGAESVSVNGREITELAVLWPGDYVKIANTEFLVQLKPSEIEPPRQQSWGLRCLHGRMHRNYALSEDDLIEIGERNEISLSVTKGQLTVKGKTEGDLQINGIEQNRADLFPNDRLSTSAGLFEVFTPAFDLSHTPSLGEITQVNLAQPFDKVKWLSVSVILVAVITGLILIAR